MKLPEWDKQCEKATECQCGPFELGVLHCLRSIAVSLESAVMLMATQFDQITPSHMDGVMGQLDAHSVREVPDAD